MPNRTKPTVLKMLAGNPGKRPLNKREPKPKVEMPPQPAGLPPLAIEKWDFLAEKLVELELLTTIDWDALAAYCQAYAYWRDAVDWMNEHGTTEDVLNQDGSVRSTKAVPQVDIAVKFLDKMLRFGAKLGLSPADRVNLVGKDLSKKEKTSAWDEVG